MANQSTAILDRAQGCLLGQLAGDSLGSLVEFLDAEEIRRRYPDGVRDHEDGGTYDTIAGQPTDDSEMALALARTLLENDGYDQSAVREAYVDWLESDPFDCGRAIGSGLRGKHIPHSEANGSLMRVSPIGIFGANHDLADVAHWARLDSSITHVHPVCLHANSLFAMAIAFAIRTGPSPAALYEQIVAWGGELNCEQSVRDTIDAALDDRPADYMSSQGWVLIALQNALWQLVHAPNVEAAVVDTVGQGGDTDTNAAICGALLGAVHGRAQVPERWIHAVLNCRPEAGLPHVHQPRPRCYWPVDALELAERLLSGRDASS